MIYWQGYFVRPTVITNVSNDSRLIHEEIFGPVVCIVPFSTEQQVDCDFLTTLRSLVTANQVLYYVIRKHL
jgi:delta 1-pyrroline-5-carboxylate dehydrogenase